jgi:uncharacterized protein YutE (UPF0331/DUF86 family)
MIEKGTIYRKSDSVKRSVRRLSSKLGLSLDEFLRNEDVRDSVLHHLQIAIQGCIDIGQHVISDEEWGMPGSLSEIASILESKGVISKDLSGKITRMFGFRNILIHDYATVDLEKVYQVWNLGLNDITAYLDSINSYFHL